MPEGRFNVKLMDAPGLTDADFHAAQRNGRVNRLLDALPVVQHCPDVKNRIFDNMAGHLLQYLFSLGNCGWPYYLNNEGAPKAALNGICLMTTDSEPQYTEDWSIENSNTSLHTVADTANGSSGGKRFEEDQVSPWEIWADTQGRDAIYFRNRVLYTPSQGVSSNIRSVGIFFNEDGDSYGGYYRALGRIGRVRLKDDGGNPIIINKTANQVLLIEYTFALVSQ